MNDCDFVRSSLELHLFFGRIMKEHSFFLAAGFTPANGVFAQRALFFKGEFERLLSRAIALSNTVVGRDVLRSGEIVTEFTLQAERQTAAFTGIPIPLELTERELRLVGGDCRHITSEQMREVRQLNRQALRLLDGLIAFKEQILEEVLHCRMFTLNYPLLIEHITREARLYRQYVQMLERDGALHCGSMREIECFWNRIMMEHAQFIRGLLDPCETELYHSADGFAHEFCALLEACNRAHSRTLTAESLEKTIRLRDFKRAGTIGIEQCRIRSVILPLLADHVLREANHYIRLLRA